MRNLIKRRRRNKKWKMRKIEDKNNTTQRDASLM